MASTKAGVILTVDSTDLDNKLSKSMRELGAHYDAYGRLINREGQFVSGLSQSAIKMGDYVDALGQMRNANGDLTESLTATQKKLRMYIDEHGDLRSATGDFVGFSKEKMDALDAEGKKQLAAVRQQTSAMLKMKANDEEYTKTLLEDARQRSEAIYQESSNRSAQPESTPTIGQVDGGLGGSLDKIGDASSQLADLFKTMSSGKKETSGLSILFLSLSQTISSASKGYKIFEQYSKTIDSLKEKFSELKDFAKKNDLGFNVDSLKKLVNLGKGAGTNNLATNMNATAGAVMLVCAAYKQFNEWQAKSIADQYKTIDAMDKTAIATARLKEEGRTDGSKSNKEKRRESFTNYASLVSPIHEIFRKFNELKDYQNNPQRMQKSLNLTRDSAILAGNTTSADTFAAMRDNLKKQEDKIQALQFRKAAMPGNYLTKMLGITSSYDNEIEKAQGDRAAQEKQYAEEFAKLVNENFPESESKKYKEKLSAFDDQIKEMKRQYASDPTKSGKEALGRAIKARNIYANKTGKEAVQRELDIPENKSATKQYLEYLKKLNEALKEGTITAKEKESGEKKFVEKMRGQMNVVDLTTPEERYAKAMEDAAEFANLERTQLQKTTKAGSKEQKEGMDKINADLQQRKKIAGEERDKDLKLPDIKTPTDRYLDTILDIHKKAKNDKTWGASQEYQLSLEAAAQELRGQLGLPDIKTPSEKYAESMKNSADYAASMELTVESDPHLSDEEKAKRLSKIEDDKIKTDEKILEELRGQLGLPDIKTPAERYKETIESIEAMASADETWASSDAYSKSLDAAAEELWKNMGLADIKTPTEKYAESIAAVKEAADKEKEEIQKRFVNGKISDKEKNKKLSAVDKKQEKYNDNLKSEYRKSLEIGDDRSVAEKVAERHKALAEALSKQAISKNEMIAAENAYREKLNNEVADKYGVGKYFQEDKNGTLEETLQSIHKAASEMKWDSTRKKKQALDKAIEEATGEFQKARMDELGLTSLLEDIKTPQQKFAEQLDKVRTGLDEGLISWGQAGQMADKLREQYLGKDENSEKSRAKYEPPKSIMAGSQELYTAMIGVNSGYQSKVTAGIQSSIRELQENQRALQDVRAEISSLKNCFGRMSL